MSEDPSGADPGVDYMSGAIPGVNYTQGAAPGVNYTQGPVLNYSQDPASSGSITTPAPSATTANEEPGSSVDLGDMILMTVAPSKPGSNVKAVAPFTGGQAADPWTGRPPSDPFTPNQKPDPRLSNQSADIPRLGGAADSSIPPTATFAAADIPRLGGAADSSIPPTATFAAADIPRLGGAADSTASVWDSPAAHELLLRLNADFHQRELARRAGHPDITLQGVVDAIAAGVTGAALRAGGGISVLFGINSSEGRFERTMRPWRRFELENNPEAVGLGADLGEVLVHWGDPGINVHALGGIRFLPVKGPTLSFRGARKIGMEAHRQILKYDYPTWTHEVTLELKRGVVVRKDALKLTKQGATVLIIKPDTDSGRISGARRKDLMEAAGYKTKSEFYDPSNPDYKPGSKKYLGSKKK
jgi:hypothetical protein